MIGAQKYFGHPSNRGGGVVVDMKKFEVLLQNSNSVRREKDHSVSKNGNQAIFKTTKTDDKPSMKVSQGKQIVRSIFLKDTDIMQVTTLLGPSFAAAKN